MKIATLAAINLANALTALNAAYTFSGEVRAAIARNLVKLDAVVTAQKREEWAIIQKIGGRVTLNTDDPMQVKEYSRVMALLNAEEHDLDLDTLSESELQLDVNAIPIAMLRYMAPIIKDASWAAPADIKFVSGALAEKTQPSRWLAPGEVKAKSRG